MVGTNVGIGTASPSGKLQISNLANDTPSEANANLTLRATNQGFGLILGTTLSFAGSYIQATINGVVAGAGPLLLQPSAGNVGIGTASPDGKLAVVGGRSYFSAVSEPYAVGARYVSTGGTVYFGATNGTGTPDAQISGAGGGALMTLLNGGNVGIGTASPGTKLHVVGTVMIDQVSGEANLYMGSSTSGNSGKITYDNNNTNFRFLFGGSEKMRLDNDNNLKVGGTAARATTAGTSQVVIFNGTAPVGTLANGCSFFSTAGEMRVMDAAGNWTQISPHDRKTNEWIYNSVHTPSGKGLKINVEKLLRFINDHFGLDCVHDLIEEV